MSLNSVYVHKLTTWAFLFENWWTVDISIKHYNTQSVGLVNSTIELDSRQNNTLQVRIRKQLKFLSELFTSYWFRSLLFLSKIRYLIPVSIQVNPIETDLVENSIISTISLKLMLTGKIVIQNNWELL